jgi:hypothetical protein
MAKRARAKDVAQDRGAGVFFIDHAEILEEDYELLKSAERLTLWNVRVPAGFLARLRRLWWVDLRGGSASDLDVVVGADNLQYLAVNQVRGMRDLSLIRHLRRLRFINLYGLPHVSALPSLKGLTQLKRAELGLMPGLKSLKPLLEAPNLRELLFSKKMSVRPADVKGIIDHPAIKRFDWFAEDVPDKVWQPIVEKIGLPEAEHLHPEEWFWRKTGGSPYPLVP